VLKDSLLTRLCYVSSGPATVCYFRMLATQFWLMKRMQSWVTLSNKNRWRVTIPHVNSPVHKLRKTNVFAELGFSGAQSPNLHYILEPKFVYSWRGFCRERFSSDTELKVAICKGFWRWYITLEITELLEFVSRLVFWKNTEFRKLNVSVLR
jgi:hypothetical protein